MAEEKLISEGKCVYCEETLTKQGISKHLNGHLTKIAKEKPETNRAFHLRIQADAYFLNVLMDAEACLEDLDVFLRAIWLECCGHMSSFEEKGKQYDHDWSDEESNFGEDMEVPLHEVLRVGQKLKYEYDFGSTTQLEVNVLSEHKVAVPDGLQLLSRNEPLKLMCATCGKKPAKKICSLHGWDAPSMFCAACATKHKKVCPDAADYSLMSIVNSPRTGVCAYDGGIIDTKRDGIWKE
jgi:Plasmid pRiA4b ORF-3-like protein